MAFEPGIAETWQVGMTRVYDREWHRISLLDQSLAQDAIVVSQAQTFDVRAPFVSSKHYLVSALDSSQVPQPQTECENIESGSAWDALVAGAAAAGNPGVTSCSELQPFCEVEPNADTVRLSCPRTCTVCDSEAAAWHIPVNGSGADRTSLSATPLFAFFLQLQGEGVWCNDGEAVWADSNRFEKFTLCCFLLSQENGSR